MSSLYAVQSRLVSSIVERKSAPANSFSVIADDSRAATAAAAAAVAEERIHQSRPPSALWLINTTRTATNCPYTVQHAAQLRTDVRPLPVLRSARVFFSSFSYFLPARRYASAGISYDPVSVCLCLSVCHKLVFCRNAWADRASFWRVDFFRPILHCALSKFGYLQN